MTATQVVADPPMSKELAKVIGEPTSSPWREEALGRIAEMCTLLNSFEAKLGTTTNPHATAVRAHLDAASDAVHTHASWWSRMNGASFQRVMANLDAAQANLLRLAPDDYVQSNLANFYMLVHSRLPSDDPRLTRLATLERAAPHELTAAERNIIAAAVQGAAAQGRSDQQKARSFRNVILTTALLTAALAVIVAVVGWVRPDAFPVCFAPGDEVVCPTNQVPIPPASNNTTTQAQVAETTVINATTAKAVQRSDIALIEFIGLLGAAVAAAVSLRDIRRAVDPHSLSVALTILKVVTGALTAFLGLLLIRAQFVPGLTALDSSSQIIAWAIILGYAQQLFTRAVDRQAASVLEQASPQLQPEGRPAGERRLTPPSPSSAASS